MFVGWFGRSCEFSFSFILILLLFVDLCFIFWGWRWGAAKCWKGLMANTSIGVISSRRLMGYTLMTAKTRSPRRR